MKRLLALSIILPVFGLCQQRTGRTVPTEAGGETLQSYDRNKYATIADIPVPSNFVRVPVNAHSFGAFLRNLELKEEKVVYFYNGQAKANQDAQFAVINISVGKKDLQQCADAVMRLRAEYLYAEKKNDEIKFIDNAKVVYSFTSQGTRKSFDQYLEKVFSYCGTLSLEQQLCKRSRMDEVQIGDVLIKGGSPGHAMLVVDMAIDDEGKKIILLSQGYMPAQDIHVVINPKNGKMNPWYVIDNEVDIHTPEWTFRPSQLRHW